MTETRTFSPAPQREREEDETMMTERPPTRTADAAAQ